MSKATERNEAGPDAPIDPDAPADAARTRARRLARRLVYGSFLLLATAFVVSSAWQLIAGIYAPAPVVIAPAGAPAEARACSDGIARLSSALERGFVAASTKEDEASALRTLADGMQPEWADQPAVEQACATQPRGQDAYAALLRLKLAEEGFVRRQIVEIAPVRRDVRAYLPH
jgi:hypothetical protein